MTRHRSTWSEGEVPDSPHAPGILPPREPRGFRLPGVSRYMALFYENAQTEAQRTEHR